MSKKDKEVDFLERKASVASAVAELQEVCTKRHEQLKARYDYLQGTPVFNDIIRDVDSFAAIAHSLTMTIIAKVNSLVLDEEDKRLAVAMKKMTLAKPAQEAAVQGPKNELSELRKTVANLTKVVGVLSGKVSTCLYSLLCACVGHLSLTPSTLESLVVKAIEAGWEELEGQRQGEEGQDRANRKTKGQKSRSRIQRHQSEGQGQRTRCEVKAAGQQEERWQEVSAPFGLHFWTDSVPVSRLGLFEFNDLYGLDWALLSAECRFLCMSLPPYVLLDDRLAPLVRLCLVMYSSLCVTKINVFDYTTYPDLIIYVEQDIALKILSRFAPEWLLGCRRFTNQLHSNLDINVPKEVVDTFSAGLKYLSPIAMKKSLVKESWCEFTDRAFKSWAGGYHDNDRENNPEEDPFYSMPILFKLTSFVKPFEGKRDESIERILKEGWRELNSLLSNVPNLDRNRRSIDVISKDALEWCFDNNVLIKATDKNLGTALVSIAWYEQKVSSFLLSNKGYSLISEGEARTLTQCTVKRIRDLCYFNSTTRAFESGNLSKFLGSRLPPARVEVDPLTGDENVLEDDWEMVILPLPVFNGLPKIHKSPWGIRPVIPCHSVVQGPVSEFLSCILKTLLVDHPQILTSTKELVHAFEFELREKLVRLSELQWKKCIYLCTADIEGFYTNVPIQDCTLKLRDLVAMKYGRD